MKPIKSYRNAEKFLNALKRWKIGIDGHVYYWHPKVNLSGGVIRIWVAKDSDCYRYITPNQFRSFRAKPLTKKDMIKLIYQDRKYINRQMEDTKERINWEV